MIHMPETYPKVDTLPPPSDADTANREKRMAALTSVLAAIVLVTMKLVVGISTNSLGILSEALHSSLDFMAAGITLWAVSMAARPADREHAYGHGKFENLSALVETLLLLATCVWIVYEAFNRLFYAEEVVVHATFWAFAVVIISIVIDFSRWRVLDRVAKKHHSQALEADALHFSTDILSSFVVLLGLLGVYLSDVLERPWMKKADAVAALGVALIVIWVSIRLGRRAIDDLLDRVAPGVRDAVTAAAAAVPGVEEVRRVRLRRSGPSFFVDVTLSVDCATRVENAHQLANRAEEAVKAMLPDADVVVHVEPGELPKDDLQAAARACAARHGLETHNVRVIDEPEGRSLEMHLEVDAALPLDEAHRQATSVENDLRKSVPELASVVTHIEPAGELGGSVEPQLPSSFPDMESLLKRTIARFTVTEPLRFEIHKLKVVKTGEVFDASFHCTLDAATPITAAHEFTQRLEGFLRAETPNLGRVLIHAEPDNG